MSRPRIAILSRLAESTSVTRHEAAVTALRLAQAVWAAGGEPISFLPAANSNLAERLEGIHGVLMPGGGDVNPSRYGQEPTTAAIYGVNDLQDQTDLEIYEYAKRVGLPLLAICRGLQVVNVAQGGTLVQDMPNRHQNFVHKITVNDPSVLGMNVPVAMASCFHHQCIDELGAGLTVLATAEAGHVEAFQVEAKAWTIGLQCHPEDNYLEFPENLSIFEKFVSEAAKTQE